MASVRVVGVGHVSLDHAFSVSQPPQLGQKTPAQRYRALVGGMTANAVLAVARLGAQACIVSPVGDDAAADGFAAHFAREGIDARRLQRVPGACSSVSAVVVDGRGERTIVNHRGDALTRCGAFDATSLDGADALLADPRCVAWAEAALQAARQRGVVSIFDGDTAPPQDLQRLVGGADWAVFSTPGLDAYCAGTVDDALGQALAAGARVAVVTLGAAGLRWRAAEGFAAQALPAFPIEPVVDTTAAGDVFHGALAVALAEGQAAAAALRFASAAAALKCQRSGGALGAPSRTEVQQLLDAHGTT